jgi:hypothetical protein
MVREAGRVDLRAVVRLCPGATEWDLSEALRHLLGGGVDREVVASQFRAVGVDGG